MNDKSSPLVLVADDDNDILSLVSFRLELAGYEVLTAGDGQEALGMIMEQHPALAVLDVRMPRMTGLDVTREIRKDGSFDTMPVILLTASVQEANVTSGFESGANDYMKKPFSPEELIARVNSALTRNGAGTGA